jgi:hypothetical protein
MNPISFYLKSLYKKTHGYRPTWLPSIPLQVGDVGILENDVFIKESTLKEYGLFFEVVTSENDATIDFSSERGITLTTKLEGKVEPRAINLGKADAGFIIEFNHENGFIFRLNGSRTSVISNLGRVKKEVLHRFNKGQWDKNLVIISELIEAKSATILLSGQAGSKVELKAQGNLNVSTMDIADASLNLRLESGQALAATILGQEGITPLYRAIGVKQPWFSEPLVGGREPGIESQGVEDNFEISEFEIEISEIESSEIETIL